MPANGWQSSPGRRGTAGGATLADWLVFQDEYYRADAPVRVGQNGLFLLAPTLFAHGTAEIGDVLIGLEFARPLLYAAAIALGAGAATTARNISAARVACADAARRAAKTALQVHGAIGYTLECDISLWLAKVRALSATWGSQSAHRATVLAALQEDRTGPWR